MTEGIREFKGGREMENTRRAVTYIRVSSREQATEDKASLEVQPVSYTHLTLPTTPYV